MEAVKGSAAADSESQERTFVWLVRRLLLYIGLAFAALTVFAMFFAVSIWLGVTNRVNDWFKGGWIGFLGYTVLLFWITVKGSRQRWSHWSFWLVIVCLLTIHCLAFVTVLRIYPDWRVIWFWPVTVVEAGVFGVTLAWLFSEKHAKIREG